MLLSLGQFESTVDEFLEWLGETNTQLDAIQIGPLQQAGEAEPCPSTDLERESVEALATKLRVS